MKSYLNVAIVKPRNRACNLCCGYCYMENIAASRFDDKSLMSLPTLKATIDFFCAENKDVEFIWHGGEPLLAGKDFYQKAFEYQSDWLAKGKTISNYVQSNGVLIDESWAKFLAQINFLVGVSFDAPKEVHNIHRPKLSGQPSADDVLRGISLLKEKNIYNGLICCISRLNYKQEKEIIDFIRYNKLGPIKFARVKPQPSLNKIPIISHAEYSEFLQRVYDYWIEIDDSSIEIRDIKSVVDILLGGNFRECTYLGNCRNFATVYNDGAIYPCDCLEDNETSRFGTVFDRYKSIIHRKNFVSFSKAIKSSTNDCPACEWYSLCRGGCFYQSQQPEAKEFCKAQKALFSKIALSLKEFNLI